jgi:hypothetical protein
VTLDVAHDVEEELDRPKSAVAERLTSCVMIAWRLLTLRRPPFSVTVTGSLSASSSSVVNSRRRTVGLADRRIGPWRNGSAR